MINEMMNAYKAENKKDISERGIDWMMFAMKVMDHIENYTVPQYGDKGNDLCSEQNCDECVNQAKKYMSRYGRNSREGQQELDFLKAANYIQMAYEKYISKMGDEK